MSFTDVLKRGEDFLEEYPRRSWWWNYASHATCLGMILGSKMFLNLLYNPQVNNIEKLEAALGKARAENRSLLTVMNHMSVVDDPCFYAMLPMRFHTDIDTIRWGFGAHNICFSTPSLSVFFNLGRIMGTKRFGEGPFQGSLDAAIRILSPDDTLDLEFSSLASERQKPTLIQEVNSVAGIAPESVNKLVKKVLPGPETTSILMSKSPFVRSKTSWFHVFPEGFVLQLKEPNQNSMRYFKWGVSRLILESTRTPVVLPIFGYGFEKIAPEDLDHGALRWLPQNLGADVQITFGDPIPDEQLEDYRLKWRALCDKYPNKENPNDLSAELQNGKAAQLLRSELAALLRLHVLQIRESLGRFPPEDSKFASPAFWKEYTNSEGASDPLVEFIGLNWAIRRLQKHLPDYEDKL
ncbi:hypothetical protein PUMCH_002283 [Australozyma saopauloensis]|uniref:Tafazzin family protein n=1 Tax=Australozyma saopauloensis TaxID=291208 RepID=A0AAX4H9M6_9ASCO|nr:hypothetical protein PUMCH_002283 [[Candida] saopauloensis]